MKNIIGFDKLEENFLLLNRNNKMPSKVIFAGNQGIGKYAFAEKYLRNIYSISKNFDINTHPNIFFIEKDYDKQTIEIFKIREMIKFINHSSFNNDRRTVLIRDAENLNINSANALLKKLEEPNLGVYFILIYNSERPLIDTIKSRCVEFKFTLTIKDVEKIVNDNLGADTFSSISNDLKNNYVGPSFLLNLIKFYNNYNFSYDIQIESLLNEVFEKKIYLNDFFIRNNLILFIQLFFYKNLDKNINYYYKMKNYFYKKYLELERYNLDIESYCLEFKDIILSE